jgi:hypothetical protein
MSADLLDAIAAKIAAGAARRVGVEASTAR